MKDNKIMIEYSLVHSLTFTFSIRGRATLQGQLKIVKMYVIILEFR